MAAFKKNSRSTNPHRVDQSNVALLAAQALSSTRNSRCLLVARLTFTAPILMHRWSQKAVVQMLSKMVGLDMPREPKDLTNDFMASYYRNERGEVVVPCRVIKATIVEGAISTSKVVSKAELKRELRVRGFTAPLYMPNGKKMPAPIIVNDAKADGPVKMDVQPVRNDRGGPDIRSRALVPVGSYVDVVLDFPPTLTPDKVVSAIDGAGNTIGVGDWRPDRGGEYGTFEVGEFRNERGVIDKVLKDCSSPEEVFAIPPELLRAFRALPSNEVPDALRKAVSVAEHVNGQTRRRGPRAPATAAE